MASLHGCPKRRGISMVESLIAVAVSAVAGAAVLTSLASAMQSSTLMSQRLVASGLAKQLMDEILATRFPHSGDTRSSSTVSRAGFNDIDDYDGWIESPPRNREGRAIGTEGQWLGSMHLPRPAQLRPSAGLLGTLTRQVEVERLLPDNADDWTVTDGESPYRRVTVTVSQIDGRGEVVVLAEISGVYCEVPFAP